MYGRWVVVVMICESCKQATCIIYVIEDHSKICEKCYDKRKKKDKRCGDGKSKD